MLFFINFNSGVFSESTYCGLIYYAETHAGFTETAQYVQLIANIWKVLSVKAPYKGIFDVFCDNKFLTVCM